MATLLEGALAAMIHSAMRGLFIDATLTRTTLTGATEGWNPSTGTSSTTAYACKAIVEAYTEREREAELIQANDRRVLVLAGSLAVTPQTSDSITVRGATYEIVAVETDPAEAVWVLQARS